MISTCMRVNGTKCVDLVRSRSRIVSGYGNADSKLMIVGLAPGRFGANITGVPFTRDASGRLLQQALMDTGLSKEINPENERPELETHITNLVKRNPRGLRGRNRNPTAEEVSNCLEYLQEEIEIVDPSCIMTKGTTVFRTPKRMKERELEGEVDSRIDAAIAFMYHPAYAIQGGGGHLKREPHSAYFSRALESCGYLHGRDVKPKVRR